jgi:hypothetical protein
MIRSRQSRRLLALVAASFLIVTTAAGLLHYHSRLSSHPCPVCHTTNVAAVQPTSGAPLAVPVLLTWTHSSEPSTPEQDPFFATGQSRAPPA